MGSAWAQGCGLAWVQLPVVLDLRHPEALLRSALRPSAPFPGLSAGALSCPGSSLEAGAQQDWASCPPCMGPLRSIQAQETWGQLGRGQFWGRLP